MKFLLQFTAYCAIFLLTSCQEFSSKPQIDPAIRATKPTAFPPNKPPASASQETSTARAIQQDPQKQLALLSRKVKHGGKTYTIIQFDARDYQIILADKKNGPESSWSTARQAAEEFGGLAAINGGFFTPEGHPLGLLSTRGKVRGSLNPSSLGAGFFVGESRPSLIAREEFKQFSKKPAEFLQSGPRLVWNRRAIKGLSSGDARARSFLAWDGKNHWLIGYVDSTSLAELASDLATATLGDFKIEDALNLDGGRSSDFWISAQIPGGPTHKRLWWNKSVRNYLVLTKRNS